MATVALDDTAHIKDAIIDVENIYDEVEIDDMEFEEDELKFYYLCPCGDKFVITLQELYAKKDSDEERDTCIAVCPSCSLKIKVIYDEEWITDLVESNGYTV